MKMQKCQSLAKELEKKKPKIEGAYIITPKLDGWYVYCDFTEGRWGNLMSSSGRVIPSLEHIDLNLYDIVPPYSSRLIMEAIVPGRSFHEANGMLNRSTGDYRLDEVELWAHDLVPFTNTFSAHYRYMNLYDLVKNDKSYLKFIQIIKISSDMEEWESLMAKAISSGYEGIIAKKCTSLYQPGKRNASLIKLKMELTADLAIKGIYWTKGKKGNDNLNMTLSDREGVLTEVRIGEQKMIDYLQRIDLSGKVACIKAMERLSSGKFRQPVFSHIRWDKTVDQID